MNAMTPVSAARQAAFLLRFASLCEAGRAYAFPCDALGRVDLDGLSTRERLDYLLVRTLIGRDYAAPAVQPGQAQFH